MKLFTPICLVIFLCACGNKTNQPVADKQKQDSSQLALDTVTIDADTLENLPEHDVDKYWENKDGDVIEAYANHVDKLVRTSTQKQDGDEMDFIMDHLTDDQLEKINTHELIYYVLTYPASFSQNCGFDEFQDSTSTPKILSYFADSYGEADLSNNQRSALLSRRDSVIIVLNKYIAAHPGKTDPHYMPLLRILRAVESFPVVVKTASEESTANFTFLVHILFHVGYEPFKATDIYEKMYGDNSYTYGSRVEANAENMKLIKDLALKFYKERDKYKTQLADRMAW